MKSNRTILYIGTAIYCAFALPLQAGNPMQTLLPNQEESQAVSLTRPTVPTTENIEKLFRVAEEQLERESYPLALINARKILSYNLLDDQKCLAEYYAALAGSYVHENPRELLDFLQKYPNRAQSNDVCLSLGKYYFRHQEFSLSNKYYAQSDPSRLEGKKLNEYRYQAGYAALLCKENERASTLLFPLTKMSSEWNKSALYHYSSIAYEQGRYAVAGAGFEQLRHDPVYGGKSTYYLYSIFYKNGETDSILSIPHKEYERIPSEIKGEIGRMIGEAHYLRNNYKEANLYFADYASLSHNISDADRFMMGVSAYNAGEYQRAIDQLVELPSDNSVYAQYGLYYLGFAFSALNDPNNASQAFMMASEQNASAEVKEEAMLNYAKTRMLMSRNPFNENISSLKDFLNKYPASSHKEEINNYLMAAYSNANNYSLALRSLESIRQPSQEQLKIKQKLSYLYAIELMSKGKADSAIHYLDVCTRYGLFDTSLARDAKFWKAEALFDQQNFAAAQILLEDFLTQEDVKKSLYYTPAIYSRAYCQFKLKNYNDALQNFQLYLKISPHSGDQAADATLRMADCFFMQKKYSRAIEMYREASVYKSKEADYALYQRAFCQGLLQQYKEKIALLGQLIQQYPLSEFRDDAMFERGRTYLVSGNGQAAKKEFQTLCQSYPKGAFFPKAQIELGLIAMNDNQKNEALNIYKKVVENFPGTSESRNALAGIKNIYVSLADVDEYFNYVSKLGLYTRTDLAEKDTMSFSVAENFYLENECSKAVPAFEKYLAEFPQGRFFVEASYYAGDCAYRSGNYDKSYGFLSALFTKPANSFSEQATLTAARCAVQSGNKQRISESYAKLLQFTDKAGLKEEANLALLKLAVETKDTARIIGLAGNIIELNNPSSALTALSERSKAYAAEGKNAEMLADLDKLVKFPLTKEGAEAFYMKAQYLHKQGDYKNLENLVFALAESGSSQEYWMAKCFILLGDAYRLQSDYFQAKATLQSVLNGYKPTNDSIHTDAQAVMELINSMEDQSKKQAK